MSEHILLSRNEYYDLLHKKRKAESDLLSARQTIAEQGERIKELEQIVNSKTMIIKSLRDQPNRKEPE